MGAIKELLAQQDSTEPWQADLGLAGGAVLLILPLYLIVAQSLDYSTRELCVSATTSLIAFLSITVRRSHPIAFVLITTLALFTQVMFVSKPGAGSLVVPLAGYTLARWVPGKKARLVLVLGVIGAILGPLRWIVIPYGYDNWLALATAGLAAAVCFALVITPYALGRRGLETAITQEKLREAEAEHYRAMLQEREHEARATETRIRTEIARELHDVVAHSLSVLIVQAEGGYALATKKPEAAQAALATIAVAGREALAEIRRVVAVMRDGDNLELKPYAPLPVLADIPRLVENAGAKLTVVGKRPVIPPALALAAYRVVQESLTNVLKHAGPDADPQVIVTYTETGMHLEIIDSGLGVRSKSDGRGFGHQGMVERLSAYGGTIQFGPSGSKGYRVHAWLPLPPAAPGKNPS